ncbi:MAG: hypothetical protein EPN93_17365 [Spirochaetes bacterium]|nr:MAG: hypothetical protein EPN93_17365 [Spirochaetota bacterium]
MTRTNLKILMMRKKFSLIRIANELGVSSTTTYEVIRGVKTSRRIESALEAAFEMPIEEIRTAWNTEGKAEMTPDIKAIAEEVNKRFGIPAKAVGL